MESLSLEDTPMTQQAMLLLAKRAGAPPIAQPLFDSERPKLDAWIRERARLGHMDAEYTVQMPHRMDLDYNHNGSAAPPVHPRPRKGIPGQSTATSGGTGWSDGVQSPEHPFFRGVSEEVFIASFCALAEDHYRLRGFYAAVRPRYHVTVEQPSMTFGGQAAASPVHHAIRFLHIHITWSRAYLYGMPAQFYTATLFGN